MLPFASTGVGEYKKKPCISLIYKAFCFLSGFLSGPLWSGKRDSDPRPQPWQGCALPTELFPQNVRSSFGDCVCKDRQKKRISKFGATEDPIFRHTWLYFGRGVLVKCRQRFIFACDLFASLTSSKILSFGNVQINLTLHSLIRIVG